MPRSRAIRSMPNMAVNASGYFVTSTRGAMMITPPLYGGRRGAAPSLRGPPGQGFYRLFAAGVCGDVHTFVDAAPKTLYPPPPFPPPQACRPTHPTVDALTAGEHSLHMVEAVNEGQLTLRRDVQVTYLIVEGAIDHCEHLLPGSPFAVSPDVSQRRSDIE